MRIRSRREEGQAYPALLLAVIGGFAIAVSFVPLQNLLDQTGRADTASDSAALAAAKAHKTNFELKVKVLPDGPQKIATFFIHLGMYDPLAQARATQLASANGATAVVTGGNYNPVTQQVRYTAITRQNDTVKGGDTSANSKSRATAAAELTAGLCMGGLGVEVPGWQCENAASWILLCTPTPVYTPPVHPCYEGIDLTLNLEWDIHLVENDDQFSN